MGLDLRDVAELIIAPVDALMPARVKPCPQLAIGVMLVESAGTYLEQEGGGPAIGLWEMEKFTHDDCYSNFLRFSTNADIATAVKSCLGGGAFSGAAAMAGNLYYAYAMARVKLYRAPAPLPSMGNAQALAEYHKEWYNTAGGATVVAESVKLFQQAIDALK